MLSRMCFKLSARFDCTLPYHRVFKFVPRSPKSSAAQAFWDEEGSFSVKQHQKANHLEEQPKDVLPKTESKDLNNIGRETRRLTKFGFVRLDSDNPVSEEPNDRDVSEDMNFIDQYYFGQTSREIEDESLKTSGEDLKVSDFPNDTNEIDKQYFVPSENREPTNSVESSVSDLHFEGNEIDKQYFETTSEQHEMSAWDFVKQYRQSNDDLQSKSTTNSSFSKENEPSKKTYQNLISDLINLPNDVIVSLLKKSVIYNHNGIVALNKPYGLVTTDVDRQSKLVLTELLPLLSDKMKVEKLFTVHRLDRDTTGVLLLASNQEMAHHLSEMFKQHLIRKTYLAITKNVPKPSEGIIDIPISESRLLNRQRMKIQPVKTHYDADHAKHNTSGKSSKAVTHFKVVRYVGSAALVELTPETGVRHQLRVHLSQAMKCPVLGDHKYSHDDRFAPQKLPQDILDKLGLAQAKVRNVPMHLHACSMSLPELGEDGRDLVLRAPLPAFFRHTMKKLGLFRSKR